MVDEFDKVEQDFKDLNSGKKKTISIDNELEKDVYTKEGVKKSQGENA